MNAASILSPSQNAAVIPAKGLGQGLRQNAGQQQGGEGAEAAFSQLLVAVEELAAQGTQVIAENAAAARLQGQGQPLKILTEAGPALGRDLTGVAQSAVATVARALPTDKPIGQIKQGSPLDQLIQQQTQQGAERREVLPLRPLVQPGQAPVQNPAMMLAEEAEAALINRQTAPAVKLEGQVASMPQVEAALAQQSSGETSNPVVRQVATNLQYVARGEMERVRFDLFPEELGRVQVQMQKTNGATRLVIITETAQAFEALARGAHGLQQSLQQAGFDADDMRFEHRDGEGGQREQQQADERRERHESRRGFDEALDDERREVIIRPAISSEDRRVFL
ncbi:flagellar hook-length control protein FliK [Parvularcula lutaonensis]|uniref:Flagellar hook-length control protein FliK n=1 Tax=Parvularcula lutaonensis TaxID=491923 RepID=A0ABV7MEX8_9PROT|nr:flagellar hook-length control protein FliK [Parvularcula lutaonensis]GGY50936.1 hypothetical protein GCM10007148_19710 [Parvularcula lutaonensis]